MANGVEVEGLEAVQRFLEDFREHVEATKAIHQEMANVVYGQVQEAFENERSPAGDVCKLPRRQLRKIKPRRAPG